MKGYVMVYSELAGQVEDVTARSSILFRSSAIGPWSNIPTPTSKPHWSPKTQNHYLNAVVETWGYAERYLKRRSISGLGRVANSRTLEAGALRRSGTCTRTCTLLLEAKRGTERNSVPRLGLRDWRIQWRRRELNPRPQMDPTEPLRA